MDILSDSPRIVMECSGETKRTLFFAPAEIDTDEKIYRPLAGDLNLQTAGAVTVHLDELSYGQITVQLNPALGNPPKLQAATDVILRRLKKACSFCPEFDPSIYD